MNQLEIGGQSSQSSSSSSGSSSEYQSRSSASSSRGDAPIHPQRYAVKTSVTLCQTQTLVQSRVFQQLTCDFSNETSTAKHQEALSSQEVSLQSIPKPDDLNDKGTRFWWYNDWIEREGVLEELLVVARTKPKDKSITQRDKDKSITQRDLDKILESCQNHNEGIFASRSKCQFLAFRILHYLAEHRFQLTDIAIDTLVSKCRQDTLVYDCQKSNKKTLPYVTMALAYAIYHDPWISLSRDFPQILDAAIDKLWRLNDKKYFEAVMVALAAKAKLKIPLTRADLLKIKQALAEVNNHEVTSLYKRETVKIKPPKKRHFFSYKASKTLRTKKGFLGKIRRHVKSGKLLSEHRMRDVLNSYENTKNKRTKLKIIRIIQYVVFNRQRRFSPPLQKDIEAILQLALEDFEFKFRSRALMIANVFTMNGEFSQLQGVLNRARFRQHFYALSALDSHINLVERTRFAADRTWSRLLGEHVKDNHEKIRSQARHILYRLHNDLTHLSTLLLQPDKSVTISATCLELAKSGQMINSDILRVMTALILRYQRNYSIEAVYNVMAAFRYVVENKQEIDPSIIEEAIRIVSDSASDLRLKKAALSLLAASTHVYPHTVFCQGLLFALTGFLQRQELISESCLVLCGWISHGEELGYMYDLFFEILHLLSANLSFSKVKNLTRVLGKAAEKRFQFSPAFIDRFISIARQSENVSLQHRFAQVLAAALRFQNWMWWSQDFFELIFGLCQAKEESCFQNGGELLCKYLAILDGSLPPAQQKQLTTFFSQDRTVLLGCEVYEELISKRNEIDRDSLDKFADIMLKSSSDISCKVATLLERIAGYQSFPSEIIAKVILGLSSSDEQIVVSCVGILERNIAVLDNHYRTIGRACLEPLVKVAEDVNHKHEVRLRVLSMFKNLSEETFQSFPFAVIEKLIHLLKDSHEDIRIEVIQLLSLQTAHLGFSIASHNAFITKIEMGVSPCLQDEELHRYAIHILCSIGELGYELSKNTLENIAKILYEETDAEIFRMIFQILGKYERHLTSISRNIFRMQQAVCSLEDSLETAQSKEAAIMTLIGLVKAKAPMIQPVFRTLIDMMNTCNGLFFQREECSDTLFRLILSFCEVVLDHEHAVPPKLVQSICRVEIPRRALGYNERSLWIARCLRKNNAVDPAAFSIVERGFLTDYLCDHTSLYLDALDVAVKSNFAVEVKTIDKLWTILLYLGDEKEMLSSAEILLNIFNSDNVSVLQNNSHIEELLAFIEGTSSRILQEKLHLLLARLTHLTMMKDNQLEVIYQAILSTEDFQQQHAFCQLLKSQINKKKLSPEHVDMICFKQTEHLFIQEAKAYSQSISFHHLDSLLQILSTGYHQLSFDCFAVFENLLQSLQDPELVHLLDYIELIAKKQSIPNFILDGILGIFDKHSEKFFSIHQRCIESKQQLSEEILKNLEIIMLRSVKEVRRKNAYQLLSAVVQYQVIPDTLKVLLDIECSDGKIKSIGKIYTHVKMGRELSVGNAEALLTLLRLGQQREKILSIFDEVKTQLPRSLQKKIFLIYQDLYLLDAKNHTFYLLFFCNALRDGTVDDSLAISLLESIHSKLMQKGGLTKEEVEILHFLTTIVKYQLDEAILIKIISFYLMTADCLLRRKCVFLLFAQLDALPVWSSELLNPLARLMEKIYPTDEKEVRTLTTYSSQPFSFSGFFSSLVREFTEAVESSEMPIQPEDVETLSNLLLFVLEDSKSGDNLNRFEERLFVSEAALIEQLLEKIKGDDNNSANEALFHQLLSELKVVNNGRPVCRQLRLLLCKQQEYAMDLLEINEFLSIILCIPEEVEDLFRLDLPHSREYFVENLFAPFEAYRSASAKQKKIVHSMYQALKWQPPQGKNYMSKLHIETSVNELCMLLTLLHDYSINPLFIEEILAPFAIGECLVSKLSGSIRLHLLHDILHPLSEQECFAKNIKVNANLLSRWLEQAMMNALLLYKQGWDFSSLMAWLESMNARAASNLSVDIRNLSDLLAMAVNYQEHLGEARFYQIAERELKRGGVITPGILHADIADRQLSSFNKGKSLRSLLEEIEAVLSNKASLDYVEQVNTKQIAAVLKDVDALYETPALQTSVARNRDPALSAPIGKWSKEDIKKWARTTMNDVQSRPICSSASSNVERYILPECLAVCKRACLIEYSYEPQIAQLVAIVILTQGTNPGILAQVYTGEGKSLIIAILAVIKGLQGKTIDVITSSPVLAKRDVKYFQPFYEFFNLKAANNADHHYTTGLKVCYANDISIVYSDPNELQFDALHHEYSQLGTRGQRGFGVVIIDESDNVLVEGIDTLAMLASPMPSMQELTPLLICIWIELVHLDQLLQNPEAVLSDGRNPFSQIDRENPESAREKIEAHLLSYVQKISDGSKGGIRIPKHLMEFASNHTKEWVHSAWLAFYVYSLEHHYLIKNNHEGVECIAPVDFSNTGGVQIGTSWGEGLHQFLQIKHALTVDPLTLVTNYSSICSYVSRYSERIGLTGTLGSQGIQQMLHGSYGFKSVEIPTFLPNKRLKMSPQLLKNKQVWLEYIVFSAMREAGFGRVVLIICETIETANEVHKFLEGVYTGGPLLMYVDDKTESTNMFEKEHGVNTIIVATNLAGRGTDVKISKEVITALGLHVCVTFLPANSRVGNQAFGRGSRRGEPGSVQLVLNQETLRDQLSSATDQQIEELDQNPHLVETLRDNEEAVKLKVMQETKLPDLHLQDKLFNRYLSLLKEIREIDEAQQSKSVIDKAKQQFSAKFIYRDRMRHIKRSALEEEWGRWLRNIQPLPNEDEAIAQFQLFREKMLTAYLDETIIQNPIYYIRLGNEMLDQANSFRNILSKNALYRYAIEAYDQAISMDRNFSHYAFYHKAYAIIQLKKRGHKEKAKELLQEMQEVLMNGPLEQLQTISLLFNNFRNNSLEHPSHALSVQFKQELQVYQLLLESAQEAISQIEESQKLIQIQTGAPCFSDTHQEKLVKEAVIEQLGTYNPSSLINIVFHHLKTHQDLNECSQLRDTVKTLPPDAIITLSFDGGKLYSKNGKKLGLKKLLPINRHHMYEKQAPQSLSSSSSQSSETSSSTDPVPMRRTPVGFKESVKSALKPVGSVKKAVVKKFEEGKDYYDQQTGRLSDWLHSYKVMDVVPVTLTLRNLSSSSIKAEMESVVFPPQQLFGIGPIALTPPLLDNLKRCSPALGVTVWFPSTSGQIIDLSIPHEPIEVGVNDPILTRSNAEISITKCSKKDLLLLLRFLDDPKYAFTLVLHCLDQKLAHGYMGRSFRSMTLDFVGLTKEQALKIIDLTSGEHNQATLCIQQIDPQAAIEIIDNAKRSREALAIKHRSTKDEFAKICNTPSFLVHHRLNGYGYLFDVKELPPMPYKSVVLLSALSMAEIGGGIALTICTAGFGASIGQGLISEGALDIIRTFSTICTREFDLSNFVLQKSISLALLLMSAGFSSMNDVRNAAQSTKKTVNALRAGKEVSQSVHATSTTSHRLISTTQHFATKIGKAGAKKGLKVSLNVISQKFLNYQGENCKDRLEKDIEDMFNKDGWKLILNKLFGVYAFLYGNHEISRNLELSLLVEDVRGLIYNDKHSKNHMSIIKGRVLGRFERRFNGLLNRRDHDLKNIYQIFEKKLLGIKKEELKKICLWLEEKGIINCAGEVDFNQLAEYRSAKSVALLESFPNPDHDLARYDLKTYDVNKFTCSGNNEYRREVLRSCLTYARFLSDDYFEERGQLIREISEIFQDQFLKSLQTGTKILNTFLYTAGSGLISYAADTVESKMERSAQVDADRIRNRSGKRLGHAHPPSHEVREDIITITGDVDNKPPIRLRRTQFAQSSSSSSSTPILSQRPRVRQNFGGSLGSKQGFIKSGENHAAKLRTLRQIGQLSSGSRSSQLVADSSTILKSNSVLKALLPVGAVTFKTLHVGYMAEYRRGVALREERVKYFMGQQALLSVEKLSSSYRDWMRDQLQLIKSLIGLLLIEGESLKDSEIFFDEREKKSFETKVEKAFSESYHTLKGQITPELKAIGENSMNPAAQECLRKLIDAWEDYRKLEREAPELSASVLQSLQQMQRSNVFNDALILARRQDYSAMGLKIQEGGLTELGCIGGFVIQELGNVVEDFIESKTLSDLSRARIKCLAITLAGKVISGQDMFMREVIRTQATSIDVHGTVLSSIQRFHQEYRQTIRKEAKKAFQSILNTNNELEMIKHKDAFKKEQGIRLKTLKTRRRQIKEWAKLNGFDPEMINRYSEQTNAIIFEMNAIVREVCKNDLKQIEDMIAEKERRLHELKGSRQDLSVGSSNSSSSSMFVSSFRDV